MTQDLLTKEVPAAAFGAHLAHLPGCRGRSAEALSASEKRRIPVLNTLHRFTEETYRTLSLWWEIGRGEPLYISGPAGSGKTSAAMQFCARLGLPAVSVTARARMDRRELIGHWSAAGGSTFWTDGPAALAWKHGWVLIVNEFSAAPADVWVSCNDLLEGLPLDNGATGELIERHPMARVIVTDNTRGHSSEISEGYFGRQIQDRSVMDRFWHLRIEGLAEEDEAELLAESAPAALTAGFDPDGVRRLCRALAKAGADSRAASEREALGFAAKAVPFSHRTLMRLRDLLLASARGGADSLGVIGCARTAFTGSLGALARETAERLLEAALGNILGDLRRGMRPKAVP